MPHEAVQVEHVAVLSAFRREFHACLTSRRDALFELTEAVLCADGPVRSLVGLSLAPEHRRGHGALYDAVNHGAAQITRLRRALVGLPLPSAADGRLVLGWTSARGCARTRRPAQTGCSATPMAAARAAPR